MIWIITAFVFAVLTSIIICKRDDINNGAFHSYEDKEQENEEEEESEVAAGCMCLVAISIIFAVGMATLLAFIKYVIL